MLTRDALLAYAHFLAIFALASVIVAELLLFRKTIAAASFVLLQAVDRWYGIIAGLVVLTGLARLFLGIKGQAFFTHNPVFWTKMGLFVAVGLISIGPTVAFIRWNTRVADGVLQLQDGEFARVRGMLWLQAGLFVFIPLCAAFMARGL
jgi:putative membrane protein